jgi:hypothetical protein
VADAKFQTLLRQYRQSGEPALAEKIANYLTRSTEDVEVFVWVVDDFDGSDDGSRITLFAEEHDARRYAAGLAIQYWLASVAGLDFVGENEQEALAQAQKFFEEGDYLWVLASYRDIEAQIGSIITVYRQGIR